MIGWSILGSPLIPETAAPQAAMTAAPRMVGGLLWAGRLFLLAFFTVHFGMFHFVHAAFLNGFFPVEGTKASGPTWAL